MLRSVSVSATSRSTTGSTTGSCRRAEARAADGVSRSRRRSSGSANNELRARRGSRLEPNHLLQEVQFEATVPTVRDRVVQAALKLVLEPIFEAGFKPCSYGFRPRRRAQDAIAEIHYLGSRSYEWVFEADIDTRCCGDGPPISGTECPRPHLATCALMSGVGSSIGCAASTPAPLGSGSDAATFRGGGRPRERPSCSTPMRWRSLVTATRARSATSHRGHRDQSLVLRRELVESRMRG